MNRRIGTRLDPSAAPAPLLFRTDLGEDWVVPRERVRYLVVGPTSSGALMTAYDPEGRIVGERFAATFEELLHVLESAALRGTAEPSRAIPQDAPSALIWLDQRS